MTAKHTQGPWRYEQRGTQIWGRSVGGCQMQEADHLIADVRGWGHIQYLPNAEQIQDANGRLIAAAPELLESLKRMEFAFSPLASDCTLAGLIDEARSAIAKATGAA